MFHLSNIYLVSKVYQELFLSVFMFQKINKLEIMKYIKIKHAMIAR